MIASTQTEGSMKAVGDVVTIGVSGYGTTGLRISGTFTGTITFQGSIDATTFNTLTVYTFGGGSATTATGGGQWLVVCAGLMMVRMRMTAYTSGMAYGFLRAVDA